MTLNDEDVWQLSFEFQHQLLHQKFRELKGTVVRRLLQANGLDLIILLGLGTIEALSNFAGPVLLQQLLRAMEDGSAPQSKAVIFATLSLLVRLFACQSSVFSLWYSRRSYERSRGELIMMLYEKTLARKIIGDTAVSEKPGSVEGENEDVGLEDDTSPNGREAFKKLTGPFKRFGQFLTKRICKPSAQEEVKQAASIGKIYNLMSPARFWEFQSLIQIPFGLVLSVVLVWKLIGWPCLFGVLTVAVAESINALITRILLGYQRELRAVTDRKLKKVTQYVSAIRHLRWYGWQHFWQDQIMGTRQEELRLSVITGLLRNVINVTSSLASELLPVAAFFAYTILAGKPLRIDIAFPALQLFSMLESSLREIPRLITVLLNAKIAVDRIEGFMGEPDKGDAMISSNTRGRSEIKLQDASFAWPGTLHQVLRNISLEFPAGLTVVCGKVAAGKTALLQALLGELERQGGDVLLPNETVGYCAQTPWLQSMSIRENIIFTSPYEESRFRRVLEACALSQDLATFKDGDLTNIGENGVGLSGGQKARVALARAIYSQANILYLDDPLSALDHQTAEVIVRKCFCSPLTEGRTIVLVTHRTSLCLNVAKQVVEVCDGNARVLEQNALTTSDISRVTSTDSADEAKQDQEEGADGSTEAEKFMEDEKRAHGGVKAAVYWEYIKAGKLKWWAILIVVVASHRLVGVGQTWFLKSWGEAYSRPRGRAASGFFGNLPSPEVDVRPWLLGFFLLAIVHAVVYVIWRCFLIVIVYTAGRRMFKDVMNRISHATFRFYDVTPVGRLMNRLTSDIGTVDGDIADEFEHSAYLIIAWLSSVVVIASVTPIFLYGQLQMDFVSVERVVELLHLEQEPPGTVDPPAWWPSFDGDIIFEDVTIRYAPPLDPSLSGISVRIPAGSTTALLGRTGSGKSTLALSLLATMKPESGRILIDNIDISNINTHALRDRITFIPQDPHLFPGTLHSNLDPHNTHSASTIASILSLVAPSQTSWSASTPVSAGGKNLSQGQRQLVGLARAVLRRSSVVVMDEATASIDEGTAREVQRVLRRELKGSTVVVIAHRVEAVEGAEWVVRMEGGRVVESRATREEERRGGAVMGGQEVGKV
ncbi:MAG: hypothetical protein LQ343_004343 [Gyalolechia ehrenbergii]|nr:MAG: hypothetical protein LQ343_004343 [Gyalolechia ehrenbergii]